MSAYTSDNPFGVLALIISNDAAEVTAFQAAYPQGRTGLSPAAAATLYGAFFPFPGGGAVGPPWPYMIVNIYPLNLDVNAAQGSVLDARGETIHYYWYIFMVYAGSGGGGTDTIRQRRWACGWEIPDGDGGNQVNLTTVITRAASRTPEGYGLAIRDRAYRWNRDVVEYAGGGSSTFRGSWERMYWNLLTAPTSAYDIWGCESSAGANQGIQVNITTAGVIEVYNRNGGTFTLLGASAPLTLGRWARIDFVFRYNDGTDNARFRFYLNGTLVFNVAVSAALAGLGSNAFHTLSRIGNIVTGAGVEINIDDWINAEPPVTFDSIDWLSGSHVVHVKPTGYDASHSGNWSGDYRILIDNPPKRATAAVTSSVSGARMAVSTDAELLRDRGWRQGGCVSFTVSHYGSNAGATNGQLGYSIAGAADVLTPVDQVSGESFTSMMYRPSGLTAPANIEPLILLHTKSADANLDTTRMLGASVEYLGAFGEGDFPAGITPPAEIGEHNSPYTHWTGEWSVPFGQVTAEAGTYVGNDTGQDIELASPAHWLYIRPLTGSTGGAHWWSSMLCTHLHIALNFLLPDLMPQAFIDAEGVPKFRVAGSNPDCNAAGVTYQYIAFSDPAMRYLLNVSFNRKNSLVSAVNNLVHTRFKPKAGFLLQEALFEAGAASPGMYYRGPGHTGANASRLDQGESTNIAQFGMGSVTSYQTPLHTVDRTVAASLWRVVDGGDPDCEECQCDGANTGRPVAIISYVGNGVSPRTISLELDGNRPLLAAVVPHNGEAYVRDPSHAGLESSLWTLTSISTIAIIGGDVNSITVDSLLNANGVVYDVFVIAGGTTATPDGWAQNGIYYPVPTGPPCWNCDEPWRCPNPPDDGGGNACMDTLVPDAGTEGSACRDSLSN